MDSYYEKNKIFEKGLFSKQAIKRIAIPLILEQALMMTLGIFDILMVSYAGESVVSGVSLVDTINTLLIFLLTSLATGGAIVVGQYIGSKNTEKSNVAGKQLLIASLAISTVFMMICLIFNHQLLALIFSGIAPDVMGNAVIYLYVTACSFPFIAVYSSAAALFRAMGNTKVPMVTSLIVSLFNIAANAVFIYIFKWGAFGAGFATLISRAIATFAIMMLLRNKALKLSIRQYDFWNIDLPMIITILRTSIPAGIQSIAYQVGILILTSLIATFGTSAITANAVTSSLAYVAIVPGQALGQALMTVVAQCVGAKEFGQADFYTKYLLKITGVLMVGLNICIFIFLNPILSLYNLSEETTTIAVSIMSIHMIGWLTIWSLAHTLPNSLFASGDVKYPAVISTISMFVFRIGCSYLFTYVFGLGVLSIYIAMLLDWTFRCFAFLIRWRSGRWKAYAIT